MLYISLTFFSVILETSSKLIFFKFAKYSAIVLIYFGSFEYFLNGSGVRYGESVYKTILSKGISLITESIFEFLNVITPPTPI